MIEEPGPCFDVIRCEGLVFSVLKDTSERHDLCFHNLNTRDGRRGLGLCIPDGCSSRSRGRDLLVRPVVLGRSSDIWPLIHPIGCWIDILAYRMLLVRGKGRRLVDFWSLRRTEKKAAWMERIAQNVNDNREEEMNEDGRLHEKVENLRKFLQDPDPSRKSQDSGAQGIALLITTQCMRAF
jgi:hypothetical protein